MDMNELIGAIRAWQAAAKEYEAAAAEARQINDGKSYPSSPRRRAAIKVLDAAAMSMIHDVHNDDVLAYFVALADEVETLNKRLKSLRITVWESNRDASTALAFMQKKDFERAELIVELIRTSNEDALEIDKERESK